MSMNAKAPIGLFDSGVGGFTVVRAVQQLLPREDVIYYGDGCNSPYGNRSGDDIVHLVRQILDFMAGQNVKAVGLACNTISSVIDRFAADYPFPIFSIVQAGSDEVVRRKLKQVGVLSSMFTARTGGYPKLIHAAAPEVKVYSQGCVNLGDIIEYGCDPQAVIRELHGTLGQLASAHPELDALVLGCTHYPIVRHLIEQEYPQFTTIIDPAMGQAADLAACLDANGGRNDAGGSLTVYTSSDDCAKYDAMAERLGIRVTGKARSLHVATPL